MLVGVAVLIAIAITVGIMDAKQDAVWRAIAAERRKRWEADQGRDE